MSVAEILKKDKDFAAYKLKKSDMDLLSYLLAIYNNPKEKREISKNPTYKENLYNLISYLYISLGGGEFKEEKNKLGKFLEFLENT